MDIEELFDDVRVRLPEAPTPLVEMAARRALADFFQKSTAWRERIQTVAIVSGTPVYEVPANQPVCAITDLRILETQAPIHLRTEAQMQELYGVAWRLATGSTPACATQETPTTLRLVPIPDTTESHLDIEVAMYPGRETITIPDWIGEMYRDQLVDGICGVLYGMPGQKWSSDRAAKEMGDVLRAAARSARIRVEKSNTRAPQVARFTSFDEM